MAFYGIFHSVQLEEIDFYLLWINWIFWESYQVPNNIRGVHYLGEKKGYYQLRLLMIDRWWTKEAGQNIEIIIWKCLPNSDDFPIQYNNQITIKGFRFVQIFNFITWRGKACYKHHRHPSTPPKNCKQSFRHKKIENLAPWPVSTTSFSAINNWNVFSSNKQSTSNSKSNFYFPFFQLLFCECLVGWPTIPIHPSIHPPFYFLINWIF